MEKTKTRIPLLYDVTGSVIASYRLGFELPEGLKSIYENIEAMNLPLHNPQTGWMLPIPATFVIDSARIVRARYVNTDYMQRMAPTAVLKAVLAAVQPAAG